MYMRKLIWAILLLLVLLAPSCTGKRAAVRPTASHATEGILTSTARAVIAEAERWIGTPYRYGGQTRRKGTDCSGMTMVIFEEKTGVKLPRSSAEQQRFCTPVSRGDLRPGDLVFFASSTRGSRVSHVGIYKGNGEFIHASSSRGVMVSSLDQKYFAAHFHSAGRVPGLPVGTVQPEPVLLPVVPANCPEPDSSVEIRPDTSSASFPTIWERAEAELDSIISASLDSLAEL